MQKDSYAGSEKNSSRVQIDLRNLIQSAGIALRRQGHEFVGLCPFHADTHPSFTVNVEKNVWFCFSCAEGGDAIRFIEKLHGVDFKQALKLLGFDGVPPPRPPDSGIRTEARKIAAWASNLSRILAGKLREIGNREYLYSQRCTLCDVEHLFLKSELERLKREWKVLCDLDDDLNCPETVLGLWQNREIVNAFVEGL